MKQKQIVCVLSGGLDSVTMLNILIRAGYVAHGISFDYGQRHKKELDCAKYWGRKLCKTWRLIDLKFMKTIANNSVLLNREKIPKERYTNASQKRTVVPNRNMIMLSIAAALAENLGLHEVYYGAHANDRTIYRDCRPQFITAISTTTRAATYSNVKIVAPFVGIEKRDVVRRGLRLGIDYSKTWSCYEGGKKPCGKCGTCQERIEAFEKNGITDPLMEGK